MKRNTKLRLPDARVATIAQRYFPEHVAMLVDGYRLAASSGLWQSGPGVLTLRLVYRRRSEGCEATHTYTFRGVVA